jgi:ATP-binding cassette subfamily F protein 3
LIATNNIPFIDSCADQVIEITDFGRVLSFEGNYNQYMEKRDSLLEAERSQAKAVKAERDRLEATYRDFKSKQVFKRSSDMAAFGRALQTRIRKLDERYEEMPGSKQVFSEERIPNLAFESERRSGEDVLTVRDISKAYGNFVALDMIGQGIALRRGERFLITGENGSGKSTLMRLIAGQATGEDFEPSTGEVEIGASVKATYYAPDHTGLSKRGGVFEEIRAATRNNNESEAASILQFWGFHRVSVRSRTIETLSAGEKKQLALAKIMAQHPNLLLLDEPTDYLKPEIIDRLVRALQGYDGTFILISHNQDFLRSLKIHRELQLPKGRIVLHEGLK